MNVTVDDSYYVISSMKNNEELSAKFGVCSLCGVRWFLLR